MKSLNNALKKKSAAPSRDARLKCRYCPRICTGSQGRAAHERRAHAEESAAGLKAAPVEVVEVPAISAVAITAVPKVDFVSSGDPALDHLDQAITDLKAGIGVGSKELERLQELQRGLEIMQSRLKVLEAAREEFVK